MGGRHAIVHVRGGPSAFERRALAPGGELRVGRTELAELRVRDDERMAQIHFTVHWDGERARARAARDAKLLVGGQSVIEAEVGDRAWVRAGGTDFSIFFEDESPSPRTPPLDLLEPAALRGELYAVVDGARDAAIVPMLESSIDEQRPLYQGLQAEVEAESAPYLVRFARASRLLPRLVDAGFDRAFGIFFESRDPFGEVRAHLRKLLVVTREKGDAPVAFRFYDPRVLRAFLRIATPRQLSILFAKTARFLLETGHGRRLLSFRGTREGLLEAPAETAGC